MADAVRWFEVKVFDAGDKDGTGAKVIDEQTVGAASEEAAILIAAWMVPAEDQKPANAGRIRVFVNQVRGANPFG